MHDFAFASREMFKEFSAPIHVCFDKYSNYIVGGEDVYRDVSNYGKSILK